MKLVSTISLAMQKFLIGLPAEPLSLKILSWNDFQKLIKGIDAKQKRESFLLYASGKITLEHCKRDALIIQSATRNGKKKTYQQFNHPKAGQKSAAGDPEQNEKGTTCSDDDSDCPPSPRGDAFVNDGFGTKDGFGPKDGFGDGYTLLQRDGFGRNCEEELRSKDSWGQNHQDNWEGISSTSLQRDGFGHDDWILGDRSLKLKMQTESDDEHDSSSQKSSKSQCTENAAAGAEILNTLSKL